MKSSKIEKYASISLLIGPLIEPYAIYEGGRSVYKFFMAFNILCFLYCNKEQYFPKTLKWFTLYALSIPSIVAFAFGFTSGIIGSYLTIVLFLLNLILVVPFVNIEYFIKVYRLLIYITIGVFFLQEISFLITGVRFMGLIPFLPVVYGVSAEQFSVDMALGGRSCSLFLEPSHFAHYLLPYLALQFGIAHDKRKFLTIDILIISLVILLLRSGNGLLPCAILWAIFLLFSRIKLIYKYIIILPACLFFGIYLGNIYISSDAGQQLLERIGELNTDFDRISSGTVRVYRGFWVYASQNDIVKLLGVGYGGIADAISHSDVAWMFDTNDDYVNNASAFLLSYGIIGSLLFVYFLLSQLSKHYFESIMVVVAFATLCLMESFFCSTKMLLYITIPCVLTYNYRKYGKENSFYSNS